MKKLVFFIGLLFFVSLAMAEERNYCIIGGDPNPAMVMSDNEEIVALMAGTLIPNRGGSGRIWNCWSRKDRPIVVDKATGKMKRFADCNNPIIGEFYVKKEIPITETEKYVPLPEKKKKKIIIITRKPEPSESVVVPIPVAYPSSYFVDYGWGYGGGYAIGGGVVHHRHRDRHRDYSRDHRRDHDRHRHDRRDRDRGGPGPDPPN